MSDSKKIAKDLKRLEKELEPKKKELYVLAEGICKDAVAAPVWSADLEYRHRTYAELLKEVQKMEAEIERLKGFIGPVAKQTDIASFFGVGITATK